MIIQGINEQQIVDFVSQTFEDWKTERREKEDKWMACVRAYLSDFDPVWDQETKSHRRSKRFVALSFDAVEALQAQLLSAIFVGNNWMHLEPAVPGKLPNDDEAAEELKWLLLHQMETTGFKREFGILLKQLQITGNAPYTVGWKKEYAVDYPAYSEAMKAWRETYGQRYREYQQAMLQWQQMAQQAQQAGTEPPPLPSVVLPEPPSGVKDLAFSGPTFEAGDIFNFVIDPFATDRARALRIKRSFVSKNVLKRMSVKDDSGYSVYDNISEIREVDRRGAQKDDYEEERFTAFGITPPQADQVEIHEAWGTMEIPGDNAGEKDAYISYCATIANGETLIRFEPTFLWSGDVPVQLATFRDVPGQCYGIGQLEMGLGLQDIINVRANQVIDATAYAINPEHKARADGIINLRQKSVPGGVREMGDPANNFLPIVKDFSGISLGMNELESLKAEFQNLTKSQSPMAGSRKESATRTSLGAGAINTDVAKVAAHIEESVLDRAVDLFIQLNAQYLNKKVAVKALQKGKVAFLDVSPENLRRRWVVKVRGSQHVIDKQERIQNLMMFMQMMLGNPMLVPTVKPLELAKKVYSEFGFNDENVIFRDEQQAEQIFQEMISMGLMGNAKNGADGDWRSGANAEQASSAGSNSPAGVGVSPDGDEQAGLLAAGAGDIAPQ